MPHLLVERVRSVPACWCGVVRAKEKGLHEATACNCLIEAIDILGALVFLVGSICILPNQTFDVFLAGCILFIIGATIYLGLSLFTLYEALRERGWSYEAMENALYLGGSLVFLAGTVLYWPEEAQHAHVEWMKGLSLGTYFNLFEPEFEGTLLFVAGSMMFAFASLVNGLNKRSKLLIATTYLYMGGSLLFVMGSVAFVPNLSVRPGWEHMETFGAWCFVIGSGFYVAGGLINLFRTVQNGSGSKSDASPVPDERSLLLSPARRSSPVPAA